MTHLPRKLTDRIDALELLSADKNIDGPTFVNIGCGHWYQIHELAFKEGATTIATEIWAEIEELREVAQLWVYDQEGSNIDQRAPYRVLKKHSEKWGE